MFYLQRKSPASYGEAICAGIEQALKELNAKRAGGVATPLKRSHKSKDGKDFYGASDSGLVADFRFVDIYGGSGGGVWRGDRRRFWPALWIIELYRAKASYLGDLKERLQKSQAARLI